MKLFITSNERISVSDICILDNCEEKVPFKAKYKLFFWVKYKLNEIALEYQSPKTACALTYKVLIGFLLRNLKRRNAELLQHFLAISIDINNVPKLISVLLKSKFWVCLAFGFREVQQ